MLAKTHRQDPETAPSRREMVRLYVLRHRQQVVAPVRAIGALDWGRAKAELYEHTAALIVKDFREVP